MPRKVPTRAEATLWPMVAVSAPSIAPMVLTMPSTAATMPKPGKASATRMHRMRRLGRLLVMVLEFVFEQRFEFVRIQVAADHQAQAVGREFDEVMVAEDARVLAEQLALLRRFEIRLDRQHPGLADLHQDVVEELENVDVVGAPVTRRLEQA